MTGRVIPIGMGALAAGVLLSTIGHEPLPHYLWNLTPSVPLGLYVTQRPIRLRLGTLVIARPPDPLATLLDRDGYLPRGVPLLKHIFALSGQTICRIGTRISLNGVAAAPARERDSRGRPLPTWQGCRVIGNDEVFLMNSNEPDSLDGRYFGPLPRSAVIAQAVPLWTDEVGDGRFVWQATTP